MARIREKTAWRPGGNQDAQPTFRVWIPLAAIYALAGKLGLVLAFVNASATLAFENGRDIFRFVLLAGFVGTSVSATIGVTTLSLSGL